MLSSAWAARRYMVGGLGWMSDSSVSGRCRNGWFDIGIDNGPQVHVIDRGEDMRWRRLSASLQDVR